MLNLQKFSELFTELENEVVSLDKKKADLAGTLTTLEAREVFLKGSVSEMDKQAKEAQKKHAEDEQSRQEILDALDDTIVEVKGYIKELENDRVTASAELVSIKTTHAKTLAKLDEDIKSKNTRLLEQDQEISYKKSELATLKTDRTKLLQEQTAIESQIQAKKADLNDLNDEFETRFAQKNEDYQGVVDDLNDKREELKTTTEKLSVAQTELAKTKIKDQEFRKYETEARTALETRGKALEEEERQLQVRIITSRRRNPALAKTD